MRVTKQKIVGLSVGVALFGSGLVAVLIYFLLKKQPQQPPCPACPACDCYATAVGPWVRQD